MTFLRRLSPWGVFLLSFVLFALSAAPSVGPGHDSGELTTAAYGLGVAHPPGYPFYVHSAHLWGLLLPGDYAWRINLFSGFCVALAAALLAWLVQRATGSPAAGWVAGLGFAGLRSVWNQAVVAEVFGLHLLLLSLLACLGYRAGQSLGRWLWAFYVVLGLAIAHHHTVVLALPGLLLMGILAMGKKFWRLLWTPAWVASLAVSLLFYLDMMLRAADGPLLNWGNPSDWESLWSHFLRRAYGTFRLTAVAEPLDQGLTHGLGYAIFTYVRQAPWPWMLLATWGLVRGHRVHRPMWGLAVAWMLAFGPFFALIGRQKIDSFHLDMLERFYASSYLGVAILAGLGFCHLQRRFSRLSWLVAPLLAWLWLGNTPHCRLDQRDLAGNYARHILRACPPNALLICTGDLPVGALDYVHKVEGLRPDLDLVCPGLLGGGWYRSQLSPRVSHWLQGASGSQDEVVLHMAKAAQASGVAVMANQKVEIPGIWRPRNLCLQWYAPNTNPLPKDLELIQEHLQSAIAQSYELEPGLAGESRFWPRYLISSHLRSLRFLAAESFRTQPQLALASMDRVLALGGDRDLDYLNRGLLLQGLGRHQAAIADFEEALRRKPDWKLAQVALEISQRARSRDARRTP